jgi:hypothetical protein
MILNYRQLVLEDLLNVVPVDPISDDPLYAYQLYLPNRDDVEAEGYTILQESRILGCVGVLQVSDTCGHVWATLDRDISKNLRRVINTLIHIRDLWNYKRLQLHVREDVPNGFKFAESLGFELETPKGMRYYSSEGTWYQFSRIREWES